MENNGITYTNNLFISQIESLNSKFSEIQTLESDRESKRIYSIDSFGSISIYNEKYENLENLENDSIKLGSNGWCGIKINSLNRAEFCGASFFDKSFSIYNQKGFDRKINCIGKKND